MALDQHPHRVRLLEELYSVFGDLGASGRSADYLSRSLALPVGSIDQIAGPMIAEGFIRKVDSPGGAGYFASRILGVEADALQQTLSATAIEALVSHAWKLRGPALKATLTSAFRTSQYPAFRRTTENNLRRLLQTSISLTDPHTSPAL